MNNYDNLETEEIDLKKLFNTFWKSKSSIMIISLISALIFALYSLGLPNMYKSSVTMVGAEASGRSSSLSQYSGLADLAGISLPQGATSKTDITLMVLKSRDFFRSFYRNEEFLINLLAVKRYDPISKTVIVDDEIFNKNGWSPDLFKQSYPRFLSAYDEFHKRMNLRKDDLSGTIYLSIEHQSPVVANKWLNLVVSNINDYQKTRDVEEAKKSLSYLTKKLSETNINELQQGISDLILRQIQTINLSEITEEYALKIIDSPSLPENKSKPYRTWLTVMGGVFGFILSCLLILVLFYSNCRLALTFLPPKVQIVGLDEK